jgi:hypothetical protein
VCIIHIFVIPALMGSDDCRWWYARDVHTGREGVVPAAYLY